MVRLHLNLLGYWWMEGEFPGLDSCLERTGWGGDTFVLAVERRVSSRAPVRMR